MLKLKYRGIDLQKFLTINLKPIKRTLRSAGFVLDDFATHIDKKQLSFRHPYVYTGMAIAAVAVMIANKHYGFGLY